MRVVLAVVISCVFYFTGHSQVTLTKGETIEYLNKKIKECVGHKFATSGELTEAEVKVNENGITVQYKSKSESNQYWSSIWTFNPVHITTIQRYANESSSPLNELKLNLVGKTAVLKNGEATSYLFGNSGTSKSIEYIQFPYLRDDPANEAKIRKALLYLRDLLKAEDDPFK